MLSLNTVPSSEGPGQAMHVVYQKIPTCCASASAGGCDRFLIMTGFALLTLAAVGSFLGPNGLGPLALALLSVAEGIEPTSAAEGAC